MPMDDLLQAVPKLISRIDSLEMDLKQTKLTMGNAIVKLVKKVNKLEGFLKRRNLVLTDSEDEEPEAQGRKSQDDPQDSSIQGLVTPPTTKSRSSDKGKEIQERKETKGRKVVSSLDFQNINAGAEKNSTAGEDKGQREGKAPMLSEETPKKSKEQFYKKKLAYCRSKKVGYLTKRKELSKYIWISPSTKNCRRKELTEQQKTRKAQYTMLGSELQGEEFAKRNEIKGHGENSAEEIELFEESQGRRLKEEKDDEAKDDESTKKSGKRRKQMARKGMHTSVDENDSEDSDKVGEHEESNTGTETPINPVPVAMKTPSVATYKIIKQGEKVDYNQIVREDGTDINGPEDKFKKGFWENEKNVYEEPLSTDSIWSELGQQKIISWRYYDTCRVHCLTLESMEVYMLSERKYLLSAEELLTLYGKSGCVHQLTNFHDQNRFEWIITPPWNLPYRCQGLTSPEQTATEYMRVDMVTVEPHRTYTFLVAKNGLLPSLMANETPKVLLLAWEKFFEIKNREKQHSPEDIQELIRKLLEDVQNISKELVEYINSPSWNRPAFYFDDDNDEESSILVRDIISELPLCVAITPEDPDDSLSMGDEHLSTNSRNEIGQIHKV
ncbi:hypothetical protein Tco_1576818 [Tanacetum coccineum]